MELLTLVGVELLLGLDELDSVGIFWVELDWEEVFILVGAELLLDCDRLVLILIDVELD